MRRKRLFIHDGNTDGSVVLNWAGNPEGEFKLFAEAFHSVGKEAVTALRQNPYFGIDGIPIEDFRAYPIVFLYRHALELYMKAVILIGAPMLTIRKMTAIDRQALLKDHDLDTLTKHLERVFEAYGWEWDLGAPDFKSLEDFRKAVSELNALDKGSNAFRYPTNTKGDASLPSNFRFNLFAFCEVLDSLLLALQGAAIGASEELEATHETLSEGTNE